MTEAMKALPAGPTTAAAVVAAPALSGPQKAMLLLVSLDEEIATRVIGHLAEGEVGRLRQAADTLAEVAPATLTSVHREFFDKVKEGLPASLTGSQAYLRRLAGNALGEGRASELWREPTSGPEGGRPLDRMDPAMLAALLDVEHAQTVAITMSLLDPQRAALVAGKMSPDRQSDVFRRLCSLEDVPEEVVTEIENELMSQESGRAPRQTKLLGKDAAASILKRMTPDDSSKVIAEVARTDAKVADLLKQALFTFEDLLRVDSRGIQQILKEVATDQLVLALKSASAELKEKVLGNLSSRAADMLREDMERLGPARVRDVEAAQRGILETTLALETDGRLTIAREGGGDYV